MKSGHTTLEVLFPQVRAALFRLLFAGPVRPQYGRELMIRSGLALHTVQDELRKLSAIGLISSWSNGFHRFYEANPKHALYPHLRAIVQMSEKLPRTARAALQRPPSKRAAARKRPRRLQLRSERPTWDRFRKPT